MKLSRTLYAAVMPAMMALAMLCTSCSENDGEENEYANWKARNEAYFSEAMAQASDSIALAKRVYGTSWEDYSNRRQYLCYSRQNGGIHSLTDSIAVEILKRGTGTKTPYSNDSVRIAYRTILIPTTQHPTGLVVDHSGVSSDYDLVFSRATMSPSKFRVSSLVRGVATALLYMHVGDRWRVIIPSALAYGSESSESIPKNSTIVFEMELVGIYRLGTNPGTWQ